MARTLVQSDNFNRNTGIGANWTTLNTTWGDMTIYSDTVVGGAFQTITLSQIQASVWAGSGTFSDNQYSEVNVTGLAFNGGAHSIGCGVRVSTDTGANQDGYYARVQDDAVSGGSHNVQFWKIVNGTTTSFHQATVTWSDGDLLSIEAEGTTIRVLKNGTALGGSFTQTDSDLSTGKPAICGTSSSAVATAWESGDITAASTQSPRSQHQFKLRRI